MGSATSRVPLIPAGTRVVTWQGDRGTVTSAQRDRRSKRAGEAPGIARAGIRLKEYVVQLDDGDVERYFSHGQVVPEAEAAGRGPWRWDGRGKTWRSAR